MSSTETAVAAQVAVAAKPSLWQRILAFFQGTGTALANTHAIVQQVSSTLSTEAVALAPTAEVIETLAGHPELAAITGAVAGTAEATNAVVQSGSVTAALTNAEGALANLHAAQAALQTNAAKAGLPIAPVASVTVAAAAVQALPPVSATVAAAPVLPAA